MAQLSPEQFPVNPAMNADGRLYGPEEPADHLAARTRKIVRPAKSSAPSLGQVDYSPGREPGEMFRFPHGR